MICKKKLELIDQRKKMGQTKLVEYFYDRMNIGCIKKWLINRLMEGLAWEKREGKKKTRKDIKWKKKFWN